MYDYPQQTILISEPDQIIRESLSFLLTINGCKVVTADNGKEALEKLRADRYDLLIASTDSAFFSGSEVVAKLREQLHQSIPVVVVREGSSVTQAQILHHYGVHHIFSKPLDIEDIFQTAMQLVQQPHEYLVAS